MLRYMQVAVCGVRRHGPDLRGDLRGEPVPRGPCIWVSFRFIHTHTHIVPWSEFPIVPSYPHYPHCSRQGVSGVRGVQQGTKVEQRTSSPHA